MKFILITLTIFVITVIYLFTFSGLSNYIEKTAVKKEGRKTLKNWRSVVNLRLKHARHFCRTYKRRWMGKPDIIWDAIHGIAYCGNAKAGTTNWLNMLFKTGNQNETDSAVIHKAASIHLNRTTNSISYLFLTCVRHPFTRLVSAYLDKVPRNYKNISETIIRNYRKQSNADIKRQQNLIPGIDVESNPTFVEFVQYVIEDLSGCIDDNSDCLYSKDVHWRPQIERCNPCTISFNFIAKIETIKDDLEYLAQLLWNKNKVNMFPDHVSQVYHKNRYLNKGTEAKMISLLSQDEKLRIYQAYKNDFTAFDYSPHRY